MGKAIIAGSGLLPLKILEAVPAKVVRLEGTEVCVREADFIEARFERLGELMESLRESGVTEICLAGAMRRPRLDPERFDGFTRGIFPLLAAKMREGDDALLSALIEIIEGEGFAVRGAQDWVPDVLVGPGPIGAAAPTERMLGDARRAGEILEALSGLDVSQGCVVADMLCLGIETLQGTDAMLEFVKATREAHAEWAGGVLLKRCKRGQDRRVDLPAIGPETVARAREAGLEGICMQAGLSIVLDRESTARAADEAGLAVWGQK